MKAGRNEKVWFLRGILVALSMMGQEITYDRIRRLVRLSDRQVGDYLNEARAILLPGEPDLCACVTKTSGDIGRGWGPWQRRVPELLRARAYWQARADKDNGDFARDYQALPSIPGRN